MIIVPNGKSDIDGIARQQLILVHSFGHVPGESVKSNSGSEISSQLAIEICSEPTAASLSLRRMVALSG